MASSVYFDTSVFLDILTKRSANADNIRALLAELKQKRVRIYTSILTIQEASVLTYRRGHIAHDNNAAISKMARVWTIDLPIALTAAKREAEIRDMLKETPLESEMKQRRRWDSIHIATAQVLECTHLFTTDRGMMKRRGQLRLNGLEIIPPIPSTGELFSPSTGIALVNPVVTQNI